MGKFVSHPAIAWPPADSFIRVDLSSHGFPGTFEQLWTMEIGERQFQIRSVPFFIYGLALGDTVQTNDEFTFEQVLTKGGHRTLRIAVAAKENVNSLHVLLHDWLEKQGIRYEWYKQGYAAADLPPETHVNFDISELEQLSARGGLEYEIVD